MHNVQNQGQLKIILLQNSNIVQAREKSKGMSTMKFKMVIFPLDKGIEFLMYQ